MGQLRALAARLRALDEAAAAAETAAPPPEPWPEGADYQLTRMAARLSALIAAGGCDWRRCPAGGLDVTLPDGRLVLISPATAARLREARLLPAEGACGACPCPGRGSFPGAAYAGSGSARLR
jgi:hypothetical protein